MNGKKKKLKIAVDFDGVLHSFKSGWIRRTSIPDPPVAGAIGWLIHLIEMDFDVVIFSSRGRSLLGRRAMKKWLIRWHLPMKYLKQIHFPFLKPGAHILIDDRCFCFRGEFPSMDDIERFTPWHGKGVWGD